MKLLDILKKDWTKTAQDEVELKQLGGAVYGFTTEIGALRLFHKYNMIKNNGKTRMGYSKNLGTWYFSLEL